MTEPFASSDPPTPDLPPELLIRQTAAAVAAEVGVMPPLDAAAPDLPDAMLAPAAQGQAIAGPMSGQPGPDLAESMLSRGGLPTVPVEEAASPGIAGHLLQAPAGHLEGELVRAEFPPELMMPPAGAGSPGSELSFEQKWDDLTRRFAGIEPGGSDSAVMHPPDLPAELLRPEPASGDTDDIVEA